MNQKSDRRVITKSELVEKLVAKQQYLPKKMVEHAVNSILEYCSGALSKGRRIEIRYFGSFSLRHRKSRMVRNPKTGSSAFMGSKSIPYFKPGKPLRDRINCSVPLTRE